MGAVPAMTRWGFPFGYCSEKLIREVSEDLSSFLVSTCIEVWDPRRRTRLFWAVEMVVVVDNCALR